MSERETHVEFQPDEKVSMELQKVPAPTDGSPTPEPAVKIGEDQIAARPGGGGDLNVEYARKASTAKLS